MFMASLEDRLTPSTAAILERGLKRLGRATRLSSWKSRYKGPD